jgi:hypothetical protein
MLLIKPDPDRRIHISGVPAPVRRPLDIDQSMTGFASLRTLRIYRFDQASVIEGHAEDDEVFIVVLAGSIELTMIPNSSADSSANSSANSSADPTPVVMGAPGNADDAACAAYLPPHAAYKLVSKTDADVAYARATPVAGRPPKVFHSSRRTGVAGAGISLEETSYAERLRIRLFFFNAPAVEVDFSPINEAEAAFEALIHVGTPLPAARVASVSKTPAAPIWLDSGDAVAVSPGERPTLHAAAGTAGLALIVMAVGSRRRRSSP